MRSLTTGRLIRYGSHRICRIVNWGSPLRPRLLHATQEQPWSFLTGQSSGKSWTHPWSEEEGTTEDSPLDLFVSEAYADNSFRCRLIPEVVIMVLRGAQIQRSGPAGCTFLTRRALFSYTAMFLPARPNAVCPQSGSRMTHRRLMRFHGEINVGTLTKDSRRMVRACDLCHGDIGES
ncbi:MAG: hypothetical protein OJF51_004745 [Nitrospira sp.]|nr:MAG: hypothetical protein OJF51_004745 [Nitrospira sp.]